MHSEQQMFRAIEAGGVCLCVDRIHSRAPDSSVPAPRR